MRITDHMMASTVLTNLMRNEQRLAELERQLTSGKRLAKPSDDPAAIGRALGYRSSLAAGEQYLQNIDAGLSWLEATDSALGSMGDLLQRANELAVQGANETLAQDQLDAIANEIDQILQQMVTLGNANLRGQRLFAGLKTDADAFTLNAGPPTTVTYNGDSGQMLREIDTNATVAVNVPGNSFLPQIFATLIDLRDHLRTGDTSAIRTSDLDALNDRLDELLAVRSEVGAKMNRLEVAQQRQLGIQVRVKDLLSKAEDADLTEVISDFALQQTVFKAGLAAGAQALQPSLFDYLH